MIHFPRVGVVIVNWNGYKDTLTCLSSLKKLDYPNTELIVVDNNSGDDSVTLIRADFPQITLLPQNRNLGFAGGNNVGIRAGLKRGADYIWLLNNDTEVVPDSLTTLVDKMLGDPSIGMCGSTLVDFDQRSLVQARAGASYSRWFGHAKPVGEGETLSGQPSETDVEKELDYIIAASVLLSKEFLIEIGLMNEAYFLYFEELDWAARAKGRYKLGYAASSTVFHKRGASIGTRSSRENSRKRLRSEYYLLRSRFMYAQRHDPVTLPTLVLGLLLTLVVRLGRGQLGRVRTLIHAFVLLVLKRPVGNL